MSGGEPSSIKRICPCAVSKPILSWLFGKRVWRVFKCGCAILSWAEILSIYRPLWNSTEDGFLLAWLETYRKTHQLPYRSLRGLHSKPWQSVILCKVQEGCLHHNLHEI